MIGRQNNTKGTLIFVNVRGKKDGVKCEPYFEFAKKVGDKWEVFAEETEFTADLTALSVGKREFKENGKVIDEKDEVKLSFYDKAADETYILKLPFRIATRSLFNRVLNLETFSALTIRTWQDDKGYEAMCMYQGGTDKDNLVKQKYGKDDVPEVKKVELRGKLISDTKALDDFYIEKLNEFAPSVKAGAAVVDEDSGEEEPEHNEQPDDVPF